MANQQQPSAPVPASAPETSAANGIDDRRKSDRAFVFSNYPSRKIALRIAYHGHTHDGLARQDGTSNTVEEIIVTALKRVRLIPETGPADFSRCGRTDKGVSAMGNAFSIVARASCAAEAVPQKQPLDYCNMINNALPPTIRIVGFALVPRDFDARFSCVSRTYRYYFCHRGLDLQAMKAAAQFMLGTHSFRNFCKVDPVNVSQFLRRIISVGVHGSELLPEVISYFEIKANSFLYHQIRCTMAILFLVGRGLERPEVIRELLECGDRKPQYPLADGTPLNLWDCGFDNIEWQISHRAFQAAERELQDICTALLIRSCGADAMRRQLFTWYRDAEDTCEPMMAEERRERQGNKQHSNSSVSNINGEKSGTGEADTRRWVVVRRRDGGEAQRDSGKEQAVAVIPRGSEVPEDVHRVVDDWSVTGSDWTEPRSLPNLKSRKHDLFNTLRHEDELALAGVADDTAVSSTGARTVYVPRNYVALMKRPVERTYEEQVAELAGKKRARYEINEVKKAANAHRVTRTRIPDRPASAKNAGTE